jgi:hypothetical protein
MASRDLILIMRTPTIDRTRGAAAISNILHCNVMSAPSGGVHLLRRSTQPEANDGISNDSHEPGVGERQRLTGRADVQRITHCKRRLRRRHREAWGHARSGLATLACYRHLLWAKKRGSEEALAWALTPHNTHGRRSGSPSLTPSPPEAPSSRGHATLSGGPREGRPRRQRPTRNHPLVP